MKNLIKPILIIALAVLMLPSGSMSQLTSVDPNDPIAKLKALKARNEKILVTQAELIERLTELEQQSQQLRIFSKRS